ncbi:hypothetical protein GW17_00014605 [Ensete ventricosum]|nr:hypothetical protein GW17_00014605 [Ensete ventricosum]
MKREKKRENLEIRRYSPDPDPSLAGFSPILHWEISSPRTSFSGRRRFFSPQGEKERGDAEGSGISAELEFLDRQNLILNLENKALKQRLDSLSQEQLFKRRKHLIGLGLI